MSAVPRIAAVFGKAVTLIDGAPPHNEEKFRNDATPNVRTVLFSSKGNYFSYKNDRKAEVVRCSDWSVVATFPGAIKEMGFSPLDTYFMTWEVMFTKDNVPGKPNLHVYRSATGELVQSFSQKQQLGWEVQWTADEKLCAWLDGARVLVYEDGQLERYTHQLHADKCRTFSLSPSPAPAHYVATFTVGKSGQPSSWKVYKFPALEAGSAVASKSSFQADSAKFYWNRRGTNVLVMTQTEVDKTGGSYYGKQSLSFADVKGDCGAVGFSKEGPIHAVSWSPGNWNEWVAVYGHMPAKATLFSAKCEPLFEFGSGSWNSVYYSPDGSRLLLGGFGNVSSGSVEVWDPRGHKKQGAFTSPDTTLLQWDPRAECVLTATTYPRFTVSNGFKIWHYTGALMHKRPLDGEHLLGMSWQTGSFPKSELSTHAPRGLAPPPSAAAAPAYRPPAARGRPATVTLHRTEPPHRPGEPAAAGPSKAALKQKEKREKAKAKKAEERAGQGDAAPAPVASAPTAAPAAALASRAAFISTGDPEKDKKIKNIQKKLSDIEKLKEARAAGRPLELNQKAKVDSEPALLSELAQLKL